MGRIVLDVMRWSWLALPFLLLVSSDLSAQTKSKPKPGENPKGWKGLDSEPDTPDPEPPKPDPEPKDNSQYKPAPGPKGTVKPTESDTGEAPEQAKDAELPESIQWMKQWKPRFAVRHVRAEFDVWSHDVGTSYTWDVVLAMGVDDVPVFLDVVIPFTHFDIDGVATGGESAHTHFGNATVGVHGGDVAAKVVGFWGGAWVSIPSAKDISSLDGVTLVAAALARNGVEAHRFLPNVIPIRWAFGIEGQLFPLIYLRSDFYSTVYLPNAKLEGDFTVPVTFEQIHEIEVLSPVGAGGGLRVQTLFNVADSFSDDPIHAVEPFLSYQPPLEGPYAFDLFARLGALVSLNEIAGLSSAFGSVLTIRSQVGYRF